MTKKKILAISGSTRQRSVNFRLLTAIAELTSERLEMSIYNGIGELPQYNPDVDYNSKPPLVEEFRAELKKADGIIICTPEYAHGVPGTLKNAIDWTVSSAEFSHKPTVLITASTDGRFGHNALLETLRVIEAGYIDELQLLIQFAGTKVSAENKITDEKTLDDVNELMQDFIAILDKPIEDDN